MIFYVKEPNLKTIIVGKKTPQEPKRLQQQIKRLVSIYVFKLLFALEMLKKGSIIKLEKLDNSYKIPKILKIIQKGSYPAKTLQIS